MAVIARVQARWTGFSGAPGFSNFFFHNWNDVYDPQVASDVTGATYAFFNMSKALLPPVVKIDVMGDVELIDPANGKLQDVITVGMREQLVGTAVSAGYSAPTGAVVTWRTAGVKNGRRVRGRTFLVPAASSAFQNDGTLDPAAVTTLQNAATGVLNYTGAGDLAVWSRPSAVGATDGSFHMATGASVPDMGAVLRSRRN